MRGKQACFIVALLGIALGIKKLGMKKGLINPYKPLILLVVSPTGFEPVLPA